MVVNGFSTYVLFIKNKKDRSIQIGRLGSLFFRRGNYFYVGSAKNRLDSRIRRHLLKNKKIFWHIDYLLYSKYAQIKEIWISSKTGECQTAETLIKFGYSFIEKFGCSDCNCRSHLFFSSEGINTIQGLLKNKGFIKYADKSYFRWFN